ncbi:MAG: hypothetical protein DHS20C10_13540 [marine bacterium B5-7]|nr:MAG: hypothetical protein DHS20C10_13540 [marine bacterium B5-7]
MTNNAVLDWEATLALANHSTELVSELLQLFSDQLDNDQTLLQDAYQQSDMASLRQHVHRLLGSCSYCRVPIFQNALETFSTAVKADESQDLLDSKFEALMDACTKLKVEISHALKEHFA